jgi:hypothetical protein
MARYTAPKISFSTADVFAAACAVQRINGEYLKEDKLVFDTDGHVIATEKVANKRLVREVLEGASQVQITESDREQGEAVRSYCRSLTFKILKGKILSEFEQRMVQIADKEVVDSFYDVAIASSLPASYERSKARINVESRIRDASGFIGNIGDKVTLNIEVLRCFYSQNYNVYFVTGITEDNKSVFFSYREQVAIGTMMYVKGSVKAHRDGSTQLNRVKAI